MWSSRRLTDTVDDVVDLEDWPHGLGGQVDGRDRDEEGLNDVLLEDVGDAALADVDSGVLLAERVAIAQLGDGGDGVQTGVLGQGVGDDLEGLGERLEAIGVLADQGLGVLVELQVQLGLWNF